MTKIQLRRDTAANWSTNNPIPAAGEPCFETDTGKLKIGDGIAVYSSLPYQGGTSDTAVTTDTAQTISGLKTFTNDINLNQRTTGASTTRETHIDLSAGNQNEFISASGTTRVFGMYTNSTNGIRLGTSKTDLTQGLSVTPSTLTFKNSDGTTTDLLAGGSGDVTAAGDNTFTGSNTFSKTITCDKNISATSGIFTSSVMGSTLYLGYSPNGLAPNIISDETSKKVTFNGNIFDGVSTTKYEYDFIGAGIKSGASSSTLYDVVTKSPDNNTYMANMAMPSDKYVDLELGASGTEYTAPADGWVYVSNSTSQDSGYIILSNMTASYAISTYSVTKGNLIRAIFPVKKNDVFKFEYSTGTAALKFFYSVGSEPSS